MSLEQAHTSLHANDSTSSDDRYGCFHAAIADLDQDLKNWLNYMLTSRVKCGKTCSAPMKQKRKSMRKKEQEIERQLLISCAPISIMETSKFSVFGVEDIA